MTVYEVLKRDKYVKGQARIRDGHLHLQVSGPEYNREYGASVDFLVDSEVAEWLSENVPHEFYSLAGTGAKYFGIQFRPFEVGDEYGNRLYIFHFQVPAPVAGNRKWGLSFNAVTSSPGEAVKFVGYLVSNLADLDTRVSLNC